MKKIGIGIVGLGFIANGVHIPGIKKCPDLKLAAICDANLDALNAAQKLYGFDDAHCFTDYRDMDQTTGIWENPGEIWGMKPS